MRTLFCRTLASTTTVHDYLSLHSSHDRVLIYKLSQKIDRPRLLSSLAKVDER